MYNYFKKINGCWCILCQETTSTNYRSTWRQASIYLLADNDCYVGMWFLCNVIFLETPLQGVFHFHFKLHVKRRLDRFTHFLERSPQQFCSEHRQLCINSKTSRWCSSGAYLLLEQIIGYFWLYVHVSFLRDVPLSLPIWYTVGVHGGIPLPRGNIGRFAFERARSAR